MHKMNKFAAEKTHTEYNILETTMKTSATWRMQTYSLEHQTAEQFNGRIFRAELYGNY